MHTIIFDLDHTLFTEKGMLHAGAADLLAILNRLGVHVAGLSAQGHHVLVRLDEAGVRHHFKTVLCADQHAEPKAEAGVMRLLSLIAVKPQHVALVSSFHGDLLLGKDIGLGKTIGIAHKKDTTGQLKEAAPDHIVKDIQSVLDVLG